MQGSPTDAARPDLKDPFGRTLDYLRISLTEDCNFRCNYCVPPEGVQLAERKDLLGAEEIVRLAGIFARLGVKRVRLTGGEPLLRRDVVSLVREISSIPGLADVALTTNGSLLAPLAAPLREAGLKTVNVSLDSLDPVRFRRITGRDRLGDVLTGISAALSAFLKVKINVLALSDLTLEEVVRFCRLALESPVSVRFLEFMPLCGDGWAPEKMLPMVTVRQWVSGAFALEPVPRAHHAAETFRIAGAPGTVGFIASLSEPFCGQCNRLRLTASGELSLCLFSPLRTDLKGWLRGPHTDEEIMALIERAVLQKPKERETSGAGRGLDELPRIRVIGG